MPNVISDFIHQHALALFHMLIVALAFIAIGVRGLLTYRGHIQSTTWVDHAIGIGLTAVAAGGILYHLYRYFSDGHRVTNLIHLLFIFPVLLFIGVTLLQQKIVHPVLYVILISMGLSALTYHLSRLMDPKISTSM